MRSMKTLQSALIVLILITSLSAFAQDKKNETDKNSGIKELIDSKRFVFIAESVTPQRGGLKILSTEYTLTVSPDTIVCDLPYYGRAYVAPMNTAEAGIKFTSMKFEYTVKDKKKKGWNINIKTTDQPSSVQM